MNASPATTVCRACGKAFMAAGSGIGRLCLGCLFTPVFAGEDGSTPSPASEPPAPPPTGSPGNAGTHFAHYKIDTKADGSPFELGRGAMGITFRACDTILQCAVALKVVNPALAGDGRARARFLREAQAAAGLRHPHVASVLFFGERPGDHQLFYAMELVAGETLHARVRRCGGLPAGTVLEIGAQVADALAAAEACGLTHRDLKPANLMLVEGAAVNVKVIDFGLAKAVAGESADAADLTRTEDFVGTPAFASPEHFNPWQEVDARSDFYALGATLWYALTGRVPFAGRSPAEIQARQLHGFLPMEQLRAARVPRPVGQLLRALLSPDPAGRPQTARTLVHALEECRAQVGGGGRPARWRAIALAAAAAALLLACVVAGWMIHAHRPTLAAAPPAPAKSVAVLPFDDLSAGKDNAFFADGVQGEILTDLSKVADLKVISRASVLPYRSGLPRNLREIAAALGVAHVLEGSVQRAGGKVRVSARLIDARTDTQLWAEKYDRDLADVFAIQSDIAQAIADQLRVRISSREKAAVQERPTGDLAAYDLYLRAKELLDWTEFRDIEGEKALPEIIRLLNEAVNRDPKFLEALCLLSYTQENMYWYGYDPTPTRFALAEEVLSEAARLRPDAGEVHLARALHIYHQYDYAQALREIDLAARTLPNSADVFLYRAYIYRREGRWDESLREHEKGIALNPRDEAPLEQLLISHFALHRFGEAARVLDRLLTIASNEDYLRGYRSMVDVYGRADPRAASARLPLLLESPKPSESLVGQAIELALCTRDAALAHRALAVSPAAEFKSEMFGQNVPRAYEEGLAANLSGDPARAQAAFQQARNEMAAKVAEAPANPTRLIVLGLIDAALGRGADAVGEGERSVRLLRQSRDVFETPFCVTLLAAIHAAAGEKDQALNRLGEVVNAPGGPSYGFLRLHPLWDPLRGDERFEAFVNQSAPPDLRKAPAADSE